MRWKKPVEVLFKASPEKKLELPLRALVKSGGGVPECSGSEICEKTLWFGRMIKGEYRVTSLEFLLLAFKIKERLKACTRSSITDRLMVLEMLMIHLSVAAPSSHRCHILSGRVKACPWWTSGPTSGRRVLLVSTHGQLISFKVSAEIGITMDIETPPFRSVPQLVTLSNAWHAM